MIEKNFIYNMKIYQLLSSVTFRDSPAHPVSFVSKHGYDWLNAYKQLEVWKYFSAQLESIVSLFTMHKKIKEEINAFFFSFFFFLQNITQSTWSMVPNIEKFAIQQTVLEQTAVIVKYKFIKCKQSVEGSIISQILKLPYSNGDVNEMEIIQ